ncbi:hypothetical protein ACGFIY_21525 [Micromonospora chersina]|uniref:hypothetical protein n=1 Tax=Micromonospora chersina TaxID=47854 RepID=UPI0037132887
MNLFGDVFDELNEIVTKAERDGVELTIDQQLKVTEIRALLSISQELSGIHHNGINPKYDSGN